MSYALSLILLRLTSLKINPSASVFCVLFFTNYRIFETFSLNVNDAWHRKTVFSSIFLYIDINKLRIKKAAHISLNATTDVQHGIMDKDLDEDDDENKVEKDEGSPSVS